MPARSDTSAPFEKLPDTTSRPNEYVPAGIQGLSGKTIRSLSPITALIPAVAVPFIVKLSIEIVYNVILTIILYPLIQKGGYKLESIFKQNEVLTRYF